MHALQLPVFQRRAQRQLVQHQKFFYFDVGVYRSLRPRGPLDAPEEIEGLAPKLWWPSICGRSASCGDGVTPSASGARGPDWRWILWCMAPICLQAFGADYPEAERWLLSFSPEPLGIDGIRCEPLELWLQQLQVEPPG